MYEDILNQNLACRLKATNRTQSLPWKITLNAASCHNLDVFMNLCKVMKDPAHPLRNKIDWNDFKLVETKKELIAVSEHVLRQPSEVDDVEIKRSYSF
eukprot:GFUD01049877.1.p1 GENE.GFUD01049877.1~~GFUD01049877.1.p1  ORF type:complete len:107 (+),score=13.68 GFUD01049877.1:30-323(+)